MIFSYQREASIEELAAMESAARKINSGGFFAGDRRRVETFRRLLTKQEIAALAMLYHREFSNACVTDYFHGIMMLGTGSAVCFLAGYEERKRKAKNFRARKSVRREVFARYGNRCANCGSSEDLTLDHIRPTIFNSEEWTGNLQVLCRSCNSSKGTSTEQCDEY